MDHIPNVNGQRLDLKVPYYASGRRYHGDQNFNHGGQTHDGGEFWDRFPERSGYPWLVKHITVQEMNLQYQSCSKEDFQAFAQSWMFFGVLQEYLGDEYREMDFLTEFDQHAIQHISTRATRDWSVRDGNTELKVQRRGQRDLNIDLLHCNGVLRKALARSVLWERFAMGKDESWIELSLSFKLILEVLAILPIHIAHTKQIPAELSLTAHEGPSLDLIRSRLLQDSRVWCIHQVNYLCSMLSYTALIYLTGFSRPNREGVDHKRCAKYRVCKAYDVDIGTNMEPVHVKEGCDCMHVEAPGEERARILSQGGIPVLSCREYPRGKFELHFKPASPSLNYVVISHLWADGLGNVFENSLPKCQLSRLLRAVQISRKPRVFPLASQETLLWLDVYCIPAQIPQSTGSDVHSEELAKYNEELKSLKIKAIARMDATYTWAECIIAIDHELAETVTRDRHPIKPRWYQRKGGPGGASIETIAAMAISPWNTRCWTYQEHALAKRTVLQGTDQQTEFDVFLADSATETSLHRQFMYLTGRRSVTAGDAKARNDGKVLLKSRIDQSETSRFGFAWNAFYGRSTTQWSDMIVVLANMLDLNAAQV